MEGIAITKVQILESHHILLELLIEFDAICKKHGIPYTLSAGTRLGAVRHGGFIPWDDDADVILTLADYKRFLQIIRQELKPQRGYYDANLAPYTWRRTHGRYTNLNTTYYAKHHAFLNLEFGCRIDVFVQLPLPDDEAYRKVFMNKVRDWENFLYLSVAKRYPYSSLRYLYFQVQGALLGRKKVEEKLFGRLTLPASVKTSRYIEPYEPFESVFDADSFSELRYVAFENAELPVPGNAEKTLEERYGQWRLLPPQDKQVTHHAGVQDCSRPYKEYAQDFMPYINSKKWERNCVAYKFFSIQISKLEQRLNESGVRFKKLLRGCLALIIALRKPSNNYLKCQKYIVQRPEMRFKFVSELLPRKDELFELLNVKDFDKLQHELLAYDKFSKKLASNNVPFCFDKDFYMMLIELYQHTGRSEEHEQLLGLKSQAFAYCDS